MIRAVLVVCIASFVVGCSADGSSYLPGESREVTLYRSRCSICHAAPHPKRQYSEEWAEIVNIMEERMSERNLPALHSDERAAILEYLKENAR